MNTAPGDSSLRRLRWSVFISATLGYSLYYVCRLSLSVVKTPLVKEGVLTESQLGIIGSGLFYAYALGKLVNGFLADRANITRFLAFGLLGAALVNLALGLWTGFWLFAVLWLCNGWFQSMGSPSCVVGLTRWFPRGQRGAYYGFWSASHNIGEAFTFIGTAFVVVRLGWRHGFLAAALAGFAGVGLILLCFHNRPPAVPGTAEAGAPGGGTGGVLKAQLSLLRNPVIWQLALASAFMYVTRYAINSWGIYYLENGCGYSTQAASSIISVNTVCGIAGTVLSGWTSVRLFRGNHFPPALAAGLLNAASLAAFLWLPGGHPAWHTAAMIGFGVSIGALICYLGGMIAVDLAPRDAAGAALGIVGIASYAGAGCQDIASGFLIEHFKIAATGPGATARFDFLPAGLFWLATSLASAAMTAWIWRAAGKNSRASSKNST
jgi:OPA family sugar phosphate sensor protein UhpC-like MFS transporter